MIVKSDRPRTDTERSRVYRAKMRSEGFKLLHLWAHPDDEARIKAFAGKLLEKRKGAK